MSPFELQMYRNAKSLVGGKKPMDRDASIFMFGMEKATPLLIVVPERFVKYELLNRHGEAYVTDVASAQRTKCVGEFLHEVYEKNKRNLCGIRADELQLYCSKEAYQRKDTPLLPSSLLHVDETCQAKAIIVPPRTIWYHVIDVVEADNGDYDDDDAETTQLNGSVRTVGRLLKLLCKTSPKLREASVETYQMKLIRVLEQLCEAPEGHLKISRSCAKSSLQAPNPL